MDSKEFLEALRKFNPDFLNGAVIFHMDKETKQVKSISPICPVNSVEELYMQLSHCRDGIQHFLNDLVDKGLAKN
jgi:hypothetical protein